MSATFLRAVCARMAIAFVSRRSSSKPALTVICGPKNFDREFVDIFAIQDEIANAIVQALTGELGMGGEKAVTVEAATENLDAYEMYLTARELFIKRDQLPESIRLFRKAVELDPNFARAWAGLGAVEAVADEWIFGDGIDHAPLAKVAAEKALSLNPDLSMPLAVLGLVAALIRMAV